MTMELEFERDTIVCYETLTEVTLCQEETLESIVPDACPDILRIVDVCGQATLSSKAAKEGMAVVTGMVRAVILYQPEGSAGLRRMEVGLPFTCQAEAPGLTDQGYVEASPRLRCAEARALNPRKVLLRVDLAVDVTALQPTEIPICSGASDTEDHTLCQRQYQGENYQISSIQEKPFTFTEQIRLQGNQGEIPQLLASRASAVCSENKLIGTKLILKGVVEGDCQVLVEITDFRCGPSSEDSRSLEVTLELLAQAEVRCHRPVTLLQDLYSTSWQLEADRDNQQLFQLGEQSIRPQAVRELLETGEMVRSVVDSRLALGQVSQSREGKELVLTAEAWITVMYLDENEMVQCVRRTIPVQCRLNCSEGSRCSCRCSTSGEVFATPSAGGVEVRFTVEFHCLTTECISVPVVRGARLGEARCSSGVRPSVVLRLAAPGEDIWDIAKAYGTTTQEILQANELEEGTLPTGIMLLIPSTR